MGGGPMHAPPLLLPLPPPLPPLAPVEPLSPEAVPDDATPFPPSVPRFSGTAEKLQAVAKAAESSAPRPAFVFIASSSVHGV